MFAIARNVVVDHRRALDRRPRLVALDEHADELVAPRQASYGDDLDAALGSLPDHVREVFVLVEVFGLRYREVGAVVGCAEGTVKSRMFHARRHLRSWVEGDGEVATDG